MKNQKRKLIATFKGPIVRAFENDRVEITGKYRKGVYEALYDGRGLIVNPYPNVFPASFCFTV